MYNTTRFLRTRFLALSYASLPCSSGGIKVSKATEKSSIFHGGTLAKIPNSFKFQPKHSLLEPYAPRGTEMAFA